MKPASLLSPMQAHALEISERCEGMSATVETMLDTIPPGENPDAVNHIYRRSLAFTSMLWSN